MWAFRLKAGRRIRKGRAVTNLQFVTRARAEVVAPSKVSTGLRSEGISFIVRHHRKSFGLRRPNAKVRFVFADNLRSYRITPLHSGVLSSGHRSMVVLHLPSPVKLVRPN